MYYDFFGNRTSASYTEDETKSLFLEAYKVASLSPDPSNQCGAIIVKDRWLHKLLKIGKRAKILSYGSNKFHKSIEWDDKKIKDRDWKLFHIEHAERNSLYSLARRGIKTSGLTMICPWFACSDCARAILHMGITKVIGHKERMDKTPERWKASVDAGLELLHNGGVTLEFWSGIIGEGSPVIVNGELWRP